MQWLVAHIDALIPFVIGVIVCVQAFLKRNTPTTVENAKSRKALPAIGMGLMVLGVFRCFTDSVAAPSSSAYVGNPVTASTDDGLVSAEFPAPPVRQEVTDEAPGIKVRRVTRECDLDGSQVNLRLSYNEYAPGGKDAPVPVLLENLEQALKPQGFDVTSKTELPDSIHELVMDRPKDGARMVFRIWFGPDGVYRALATTVKGHHDDPRAARLISSFRRNLPKPADK